MSTDRIRGTKSVVHAEDAVLQSVSLPPQLSARGGAAVATVDDHLYGPHTSTIRMNPYVRCVLDDGVPKIRSLQELLAPKTQPEPPEPDTPCLRPSHGPAAVWAHTPDSLDFDDGLVTMKSACRQSAFHSHDDAERCGAPVTSNSSPELIFTADSVATPNTFAMAKSHEMRILSRLTKRLRRSERHRDMPFKEPIEMVLSETDEDEGTEAGMDGRGSEMMGAAQTGRPAVFAPYTEDLARKHDRICVQLLPCSTHAKAEAAALGGAADDAASERTLQRTGVSSHLAAASCLSEQRVPPQSSSGAFCAFAVGPTPSDGVTSHVTDAKHSDLSEGASRHHHRHSHGQQGQHLRIDAVPLHATYPVPVARLEESPYHYIMRNYSGGTFLYYSTQESKEYFLRLCHRVVAQVRPLLEQETLSPHHGLFPRISAPAFVFGDIHGNFEDLSFFLKRLLIFHDFNLTPANILCLGDYVDRGPFSLECVMLLFSLKIMNASKLVMLRGNHEDRVVCGDLRTYGRGCFLAQCHTVFGYTEGTKLFLEVTALFKYLPLAAELVIPSTPNMSFLQSQQTVVHPNLYVSQPAVLIHDGSRVKRAAPPSSLSPSSSTRASPFDAQHLPTRHRDGEVASGDRESDDALLKSAASAAALPSLPTGYSTIADASLARRQPSPGEAHEERILCTHGGIPRFERSPLEENPLAFLRSLSFPRMLTLFPNNPTVRDDPECMPDFFVKEELAALWRRHPSAAPLGFTSACQREAAEAAAAAGASAAAVTTTCNPCASPSSDALGSEELPKSTSVSSVGSSASDCDAAAATVRSEAEAPRRSSWHRAVESSFPSPAAKPQSSLYGKQQQSHLTRLRMRHSRDYLPQLTEDDVRKGWYTMFDLLWSDPTPMEVEEGAACAGREASVDADGAQDARQGSSSPSPATAAKATSPCVRVNEWGFAVNARGSNVISFSAKAVDTFLTAYHYSMLFRAHQEKAHGLRWSKSNKVLTIFSSSNYMGHHNGAGCVVVAANGEVQMIEKVAAL
ncbi:hypothetical protein LSCM1_04223 [Leishmania martiniquensis]|uniref:protein-serine/threonine phosphatase n=1 Tax=Leishmania martiniquensis TaxID=1580590 RepID=A0A836KN04_9TRYP|nr:hypothetical protein LSCM1_04223 [Leishmania martiniquensis]